MEEVSETAKATQEIAKAAGKGIDATRALGGFVARYIAGPLEQASGIVEDKLAYMRWERQQRFMLRAEEFLRARGLAAPTKAVPLKLAIPLLQAASIEDDDELQDMWARLLVNAADAESGIDVKRAFVDILGLMSPLEARILKTIYSMDFEQTRARGAVTADLPAAAAIEHEDRDSLEPPIEIALALGNLTRLGVLRHPSTWGGGETFRSVNTTLLGKTFMEAVAAPASPSIRSP